MAAASKVRRRGAFSSDFRRNDLALCVLLALLTLLGYQFAAGHQTEQFPLIFRLLDPGFLDQDFYTNAGSEFGPRYYYVHFLASLTRMAPLPAVVLGLTLIVNFSLAAITYLAARDLLGADRLGGQIAAVLAVVSSGFSLGLAGYLRFDGLQPASLAIPFSLLALWCGVRRRPIEAAVLAGAASAFHPLIGLEIGALALGCVGTTLALERWRERAPPGGARALAAWLAGVLVLGAAAYVLWLAPLEASQDRLTDEQFYQLLAVFRAPHHYLPGVMPKIHHLAFAAFLVAVLGIWWHWYRDHDRAGQPAPTGRDRQLGALLLMLPVLAIVLICALSYPAIESAHSRLWITAQPFRLLYIVKWLGFLLIGWLASRLLRRADVLDRGIAILILLSTSDAQPFTLFLCLSARLFLARAGDQLPGYARWVALGGLALAAYGFGRKYGLPLDTVRIGAGLVCVYLLARDQAPLAGAAAWPGALVVGLAPLAAVTLSPRWAGFEAFEPTFTWAGLHGPDAEIARWARTATPDDSIWLVPPEFRAFRILAERAVVVDFTCMPFGDGAMREWRERMTSSYGQVQGGGFVALRRMQRNHLELTAARAAEVSRRFGAGYAVLYRDTGWAGPVFYANEAFKAVELPRSPTGASR